MYRQALDTMLDAFEILSTVVQLSEFEPAAGKAQSVAIDDPLRHWPPAAAAGRSAVFDPWMKSSQAHSDACNSGRTVVVSGWADVYLRLHAGILCSEHKRRSQCRRCRVLKKLSPVPLNLSPPELQFSLRNQSLFTLFEQPAQRAAVAPAWL
jgi:hypothetical protein